MKGRAKQVVVVVGRSLPAPIKAAAKRVLAALDPIAVRMYRARHGHREPVPPIRLRARVGTAFVGDFVSGGSATVDVLDRACGAAGRSLSEFDSVLDFGCGCARITAPLARSAPPGTRVAGCDIDRECIEWSSRAYPEIRFEVNSFTPPLPFGDDEFDLVFSISIFTHLDEASQLAWLSELDRVLAPGGVGLLTVFNDRAYEQFRSGRVVSNSRTCAKRLEGRLPLDREEFVFEPYERSRWNSADFEGISGDYGLAFHHDSYLRRAWEPIVHVVDRVDINPNGLQQIVVTSPHERGPGRPA